ncbi:multicopper oxidase family protein [Thermomicrobium roseum]|uniref:Copper resistance protein A n=1 Tax=Thermomicrobium roseum (strain ATCC 27502 / DSM 5159 / P-2) TaxID=309801 RepID=B9L364_THERP|nr:multicopper oxidase family protein [Thermomicrobium roseum]ACM06437.1 copper resistance protein A [Thermomicrobium roseum DSM 5159]
MMRFAPLLLARRWTRRGLFPVMTGSVLLAVACSRRPVAPTPSPQTAAEPTVTVLPTRSSGSAAGPIREYTIEAVEAEIELAGRRVRTFTYGGQVPGPELRVREGETLRVLLENRLPEPTTIHWHGIPVPNAMDGVPEVTQPAVPPGERYLYEFPVPVAGTYFYHTHVGVQLDRGLVGALIVEPGHEELAYDREVVLVLDDWLDGIAGTPEEVLRQLVGAGHGGHGMGHGAMPGGSMPGMGTMPGMTGTSGEPPEVEPDLVYPLYVVNGRPLEHPFEFVGKRGDLLRLRLVNAASAIIFRVALAGHRFTVVQADGQPIEPLEGDALRIGMGERYDLLVRLDNPGIWPLVAWAEGTDRAAQAVLRYEGASGQVPARVTRPRELSGELVHGLRCRARSAGTEFVPDVERPIVLGGGMGQYVWTIDGQAYPAAEPIRVRRGQRVRFRLQNMTTMPHPMHLHGHFFRVGESATAPVRDTVLVDPMREVVMDWIAENPGRWAFHCHHLYHQETGMMRIVEVT